MLKLSQSTSQAKGKEEKKPVRDLLVWALFSVPVFGLYYLREAKKPKKSSRVEEEDDDDDERK